MKKHIKHRWIQALRSGEYKQGERFLRTSSKNFCCLGVLCSVYNPSHWLDNRYMGENIVLPVEIVNYCGLELSSPKVPFKKEDYTQKELDRLYKANLSPDWVSMIELAELNDCQIPFSKIADLIEKYL